MTFSPVIPTSFHPGDPLLHTLLSTGVLGGWRDPLAAYSFAMRLQSHDGLGNRTGLGPDDTSADEWSDVLSGSGLSASPANPSFKGEILSELGTPFVRFANSGDFLLTPLVSTQFDAAGTFAALFRPRTPFNYHGLVSGSAAGPILCSDGGNNFYGLGRPLNFAPQEPVEVGNDSWCAFVAMWSGTAFEYSVITDSGETVESGTLPSAFASSPGFLGIAVHNSEAPFQGFRGDISAVLIHNQTFTTGEAAVIRNYLWSLRPKLIAQKVVAIGDSLTRGYGIPDGTQYFKKLSSNWVNLGVDGETSAQILARASEAIAEADPNGYCVVYPGMNDVTGYGGSFTPEETYGNTRELCEAVGPHFRAVFVVTITPQNMISTNPDAEADRVAVNALLSTHGLEFSDAVIALGEDERLQDPDDETYFSDGLHGTTAYQLILRDLLFDAIASL